MGKKMHLICPKCRHDLEYDREYIDRKEEQLRMEISSIDRQLQDFKAKNPRGYKADSWYRSAVKAKVTKQSQLSELRNFKKTANVHRELQLYNALKAYTKRQLGEEKYKKLMAELEEELYYNAYDMAKQNHNNFQGV